MIYFLRDDSNGEIKIGRTRDLGTLRLRIAALKCKRRSPVSILRLVDAPDAAEAWFHGRFVDNYIREEWFIFHGAMLTTEVPSPFPKEWPTLTFWKGYDMDAHVRHIDVIRGPSSERAMSLPSIDPWPTPNPLCATRAAVMLSYGFCAREIETALNANWRVITEAKALLAAAQKERKSDD